MAIGASTPAARKALRKMATNWRNNSRLGFPKKGGIAMKKSKGSVSLLQLYQIFQDHFSPPFLASGQAAARFTLDGRLELTIGGRAVEIKKNGQVGDTGTFSSASWDKAGKGEL